MVPEINVWAVLAATASTVVVGSLWYTPKTFGTWWMRVARIDQEAMRKNVVYPFVATIIVTVITAWVLAGAIYISYSFYGGSFLVNAIVTGIILWGGLTAARIITHDAFENRPKLLTLLTIGHEFVTIVIMSLIIGLFGVSS